MPDTARLRVAVVGPGGWRRQGTVGDEEHRVWQAGYFNDTDREFHRTFDRHVDALLPALRSGAEPPVHARAGRRALQLAWHCIESYESGRRVDSTP